MESTTYKIAAVVVTYNRRALLEQALQCLTTQTRELDRIIVIENCSTDDTREFLSTIKNEKMDVVLMPRNTGGAGGFAAGIERAYASGYDLIWVMDDDVLPAQNSLEKLLEGLAYLHDRDIRPNLLACNVSSLAGEPMNVPTIDARASTSQHSYWTKFLDEGIIPIRIASFVGALVTREAVQRYGLPIAEMFIWHDDTEYCHRLSSNLNSAFLINRAKVVHAGRSGGLSIITEENRSRLKMYFYLFRNDVYVHRKYASRAKQLAFYAWAMRQLGQLLASLEFFRAFILLKGLFSGLFFSPPIKRVDSQILKETVPPASGPAISIGNGKSY